MGELGAGCPCENYMDLFKLVYLGTPAPLQLPLLTLQGPPTPEPTGKRAVGFRLKGLLPFAENYMKMKTIRTERGGHVPQPLLDPPRHWVIFY